MDPSIYRTMSEIEDRHWWFAARRHILTRLLTSLGLAKDSNILEAGCGTGGNLAMLKTFGTLSAIELESQARKLANARGIITVTEGRLPDAIPFPDNHFDLIAMLDVLEHVDQDAESLKALNAKLKPGGKLLLSVPAYMFLWSAHDVVHHHKRRYTATQLRALLQSAGYKITYLSYFNTILFPLIASARIFERFNRPPHLFPPGPEDAVLSVPPGIINSTLRAIFAAEFYAIPRFRLPFGVSLVAIAEKI